MTYSEHALDTEILHDETLSTATDLDLALDSAIASEEAIAGDIEGSKSPKKIKAHVIRRNVEDYLERKALERSLKEVFDDDYILD